MCDHKDVAKNGCIAEKKVIVVTRVTTLLNIWNCWGARNWLIWLGNKNLLNVGSFCFIILPFKHFSFLQYQNMPQPPLIMETHQKGKSLFYISDLWPACGCQGAMIQIIQEAVSQRTDTHKTGCDIIHYSCQAAVQVSPGSDCPPAATSRTIQTVLISQHPCSI